MNIIRLTPDQHAALSALNEGDIIHHHYDNGVLVIETAHGDGPYAWVVGTWKKR